MHEYSANSSTLNSWKEIAQYFGRGVRTVQRWNTELQLPVHRIRVTERGPVFAFKSELAYWISERAEVTGKRGADKNGGISCNHETKNPRTTAARIQALSSNTLRLSNSHRLQVLKLAEQITHLKQLLPKKA